MNLVTGGSGVLGRTVIRELLDHGVKVRVLDLKPPPEPLGREVEFAKGSVLDPAAVEGAMRGIEVVHHLAASMPQADLSARGFWEINVGGTLNVARAAIKARARRIVFASTIEIYGLQLPREFPVTEQSEKRFTGVYSRNKWECEQRLLELRATHGLEAVFPRMPMIFGPGFYHEPSMMTLFKLIRRGWPVPVVAAPDAPWASVASADAAQGLCLCATVPEADGQAFNIAAPDAPPCTAALRELIHKAGSRSRLIPVPVALTEKMVELMERFERYSPTPAELVRFALVGGEYSIVKARRILGYNPRFTAVEAMESAYRSLFPAPSGARA
ncbi:MAG TPA: NAD-dependent epimerase/dehydratase family protein [bacterium]|nr:NAD-dependent epimerase/dehydratase family protein [bacterium]